MRCTKASTEIRPSAQNLGQHWFGLLTFGMPSLPAHNKERASPSKSSESATSTCQCLSSYYSHCDYHRVIALMLNIITSVSDLCDPNTPCLSLIHIREVISRPFYCSSQLCALPWQQHSYCWIIFFIIIIFDRDKVCFIWNIGLTFTKQKKNTCREVDTTKQWGEWNCHVMKLMFMEFASLYWQL